jgi:hypothetical protein
VVAVVILALAALADDRVRRWFLARRLTRPAPDAVRPVPEPVGSLP